MYSTLSFLSRKADFKQVNPDIPITQAIPCPEGTQLPRETFTQQGPKNATDKPESNGTQDLDEDEEDSEEFERLQADVQAAQDEYDRALLEAETLHNEVKTALRQILDHRVTLLSSSSSSPCKNVNV
ncbi:hypothetical protein PSHT_13119 [Puccinia striiformis]|uniref:Uncharacterized protein n=1 Tax=Puccinia striiformis TaxID=27350 RepID=A0A2S4USN1_9BASI|nr:hypothetical protein PSHT_13119 [Puccinia striiformis]